MSTLYVGRISSKTRLEDIEDMFAEHGRLRDFNLKSDFAFAVGAGWGHGAGMCQIGALGMALAGYDHERILMHYFKDVTIS